MGKFKSNYITACLLFYRELSIETFSRCENELQELFKLAQTMFDTKLPPGVVMLQPFSEESSIKKIAVQVCYRMIKNPTFHFLIVLGEHTYRGVGDRSVYKFCLVILLHIESKKPEIKVRKRGGVNTKGGSPTILEQI